MNGENSYECFKRFILFTLGTGIIIINQVKTRLASINERQSTKSLLFLILATHNTIHTYIVHYVQYMTIKTYISKKWEKLCFNCCCFVIIYELEFFSSASSLFLERYLFL